MKILTYGPHARLAALLDGDRAIDLNLAYAGKMRWQQGHPRPYAQADAFLPAKLAEFLASGREAIDAAKQAIDWAASVKGDIVGPGGEAIAWQTSELKILAPLPSMGSRIFCAGGNHIRHLAGALKRIDGRELSDEEALHFIRDKPLWGFYKLPQNVYGPDVPVTIPDWVQAFDYEVELAAFIGKEGKNVSREQAREMIAGYSCFTDWSIRDPYLVIGAVSPDEGILSFAFQKNASGGSLGPYLVIDEVKDPYNLKMESKVNGSVRQSGLTGEMIFQFDELIAYLSKYLTLYPGDIISAGTILGTAFDSSRVLPESEWQKGKLKVDGKLFLKNGDTVECGIEGLGVLRNTMHAEKP